MTVSDSDLKNSDLRKLLRHLKSPCDCLVVSRSTKMAAENLSAQGIREVSYVT
jgi:queuine/archaeosine tRNA-ribosyltransferase